MRRHKAVQDGYIHLRLTIYGMLVERNDTLWRELYVQLEDSSEKPNPGIIKIGK